jgi:hypothetical protein
MHHNDYNNLIQIEEEKVNKKSSAYAAENKLHTINKERE